MIDGRPELVRLAALIDWGCFERLGSATVTFARKALGDTWVATHRHMPLFPGTPEVSHGKKPARS
ncbi:hypothetical protein [Roseomonas harenae]|uniref:hypothetical protein n=1 Tax=Muricoccus harenae TaxID=2692566 RepID=UPI001915346D|nr:hypothetical protein [Roseomonas harenae]